jgi:DNA-directed RNA polymerase subunit A"
MAKKDTLKALTNRGISDETANLMLTKYSSLAAISAAGAEALVELGLSDEEAAMVIDRIGKRPASSGSKAKKVVEEQVEPLVPMEEVTNYYEYNETEIRLKNYLVELDIDLPMKVVVDIAKRIIGTEIENVEDTCKNLLTTAYRMYTSHLMDQNESAGVMAAHSLGEPGTQMNMRTFHYAGVANVNVTQGLPRLIEIVDARRIPSTPSMDIPLLGIAAEDESVARLVASNIEVATLIEVAAVSVDVDNMRVVITPNRRAMDSKRLTVDDIVDRLKKIKAVRGLVESNEEYITISSDEASFKKLQIIYDSVKNAKIKGIDGIRRAILSKDGGRFKIVTEGSNLKEVLKIAGVDADHVMTNSILEVADVLGIEAARNSIIREAKGTLGEAGLDVDIRHIMLVADLMTNDGYVKAIGRHGVSGKKSSVLARASFEITTAHLLYAAMVGEVDNLEGVTENIIVGQPVTLGTGAVNLVYSPKKRTE